MVVNKNTSGHGFKTRQLFLFYLAFVFFFYLVSSFLSQFWFVIGLVLVTSISAIKTLSSSRSKAMLKQLIFHGLGHYYLVLSILITAAISVSLVLAREVLPY